MSYYAEEVKQAEVPSWAGKADTAIWIGFGLIALLIITSFLRRK